MDTRKHYCSKCKKITSWYRTMWGWWRCLECDNTEED